MVTIFSGFAVWKIKVNFTDNLGLNLLTGKLKKILVTIFAQLRMIFLWTDGWQGVQNYNQLLINLSVNRKQNGLTFHHFFSATGPLSLQLQRLGNEVCSVVSHVDVFFMLFFYYFFFNKLKLIPTRIVFYLVWPILCTLCSVLLVRGYHTTKTKKKKRRK